MEVELRKAAIGGALARQLHITDSFTLEAAPLTKPPAPRGLSDYSIQKSPLTLRREVRSTASPHLNPQERQQQALFRTSILKICITP